VLPVRENNHIGVAETPASNANGVEAQETLTDLSKSGPVALQC
jgi:hypothetical protein